ncbi:MAG: hypothetical protein Q4B81_00240 [Moraxella sp.]|nr:hypothetical protein [Moraxella sp.]
MRFYLDNDEVILDHDVVSVVLRHDLVPIPVTLEMVVNAAPGIREHLGVGRTLTMATGLTLVIVKSEQYMGSKILDGYRTGAIVLTAVLSGCEQLVHVTQRAVNLKKASFAEIYRACGADVSFDTDIKVNQFVCFKGQMATHRISWALQKEAACIVYDVATRRLNVKRVSELLAQPATMYDPSSVHWLSHAHADGDIGAYHLSIDNDGTQIIGHTPDAGRMDYIPRCDARELTNLSRILVARGTIERAIDERLLAGKAVLINETTYLSVTSAISYQSGAFGGNTALSIKSWLYGLGDNNKQRQLADTQGVQ